ncbi:hypothetical protein D3C80_435260 [compost metagenome]
MTQVFKVGDKVKLIGTSFRHSRGSVAESAIGVVEADRGTNNEYGVQKLMVRFPVQGPWNGYADEMKLAEAVDGRSVAVVGEVPKVSVNIALKMYNRAKENRDHAEKQMAIALAQLKAHGVAPV